MYEIVMPMDTLGNNEQTNKISPLPIPRWIQQSWSMIHQSTLKSMGYSTADYRGDLRCLKSLKYSPQGSLRTWFYEGQVLIPVCKCPAKEDALTLCTKNVYQHALYGLEDVTIASNPGYFLIFKCHYHILKFNFSFNNIVDTITH